MHSFKRSGALALAALVAAAGCSGEDGKNGVNGSNGVNGTDKVAVATPESCEVCHAGSGAIHQGIYNKYTDASTLVANITSVVSTPKGTDPQTYDVLVTMTLTKNGTLYAADLATFGQKTMYAAAYDPVAKTFGPVASLSVRTNVGGGTYTFANPAASPLAFAPETSNAFVYGYFAENPTLIPNRARYKLYDNLASVAKAFGTIDYVSPANLSACEACHGKPYNKHSYRAGAVAGLPDLVACKACHYDTRPGEDFLFQLLSDDPVAFTQLTYDPATGDPIYSTAQEAKYAYIATTGEDTHMSHAMEFAYPQSMANCVTCHAGKLGTVLTNANFTLRTCKGCHPVTGPAAAYVDAKRAPALTSIIPASHIGTAGYLGTANLYAPYTGAECNTCHPDSSTSLKFAAIHTGYNKQIYKADGTKYAASVTTSFGTLTYDSATKVLTIPFSVAGADANAIVKPTVVVSLYGWSTKDFVVSGHGSQADGTRNLEWTEGALQRNSTLSANSSRLTVSPATAAAGVTSWTATANLTTWAARLADGSVKRVEVAVLPTLGVTQTSAPSDTNPGIAMAGATKTFDLVAGAAVADASSYGKAIVDTAKCNKCHDALGVTFHDPNYGSAGVVACRLCHTVGSGGSHLEMQSRSIDSYVHAIHRMQPFDVGSVDFTDAVAKMRYEHHIESTYPNFTTLSCESCHNAGTYEVPDQTRSMPGVLSKASTLKGMSRTIGAIPSYVTGPASRACGSCHRAVMINEDAASNLAAFNSHTASFGYMLDATTNSTTVFEDAAAKIETYFK